MAGEEALRSVYTDLIYRDQLVRGVETRAGGARGGSVLTCWKGQLIERGEGKEGERMNCSVSGMLQGGRKLLRGHVINATSLCLQCCLVSPVLHAEPRFCSPALPAHPCSLRRPRPSMLTCT